MFQSSLMSWSSITIERRDGREQPPDVRLAPRLAVEAGVLLEVEHLLPGGSETSRRERMNSRVSGDPSST